MHTPTYWNKCSGMPSKLPIMFINTSIYVTRAKLLSQCFLRLLPTHTHTHTHTHTQAHMSERLIGAPNVEDTALIRDWSLQGVSPFNDHPTNQSSFSISLSFFVQVQPHARLNTLFHFLLSPTICPNPSVLSHNFKVLQNQDLFQEVQLGYFCSSCRSVPQKNCI